jgi:hypothetical protein
MLNQTLTPTRTAIPSAKDTENAENAVGGIAVAGVNAAGVTQF